MPKLKSTWLRRQIRRAKPLLRKLDIPASRAAQDRLGNLSSRVLAGKVLYSEVSNYPGQAAWAEPKDSPATGTVLYLHGGGYVAGSLAYARLFGGVLAHFCQQRVFCLGYPLAPEQPFPAALDDAYQAYCYLLGQGIDPAGIAIAGESAGGGLLFCLVHKLIAEQKPLPACLVALSPGVDLMLSGASYNDNQAADITLQIPQLEFYAAAYAPSTERDNPLVSPVYGRFDGFPPALVLVGGDEMLLDDARLLARRYHEAQGHCQLQIAPGMWHVYPLYPTAEAELALEQIRIFLNQYLATSEA